MKPATCRRFIIGLAFALIASPLFSQDDAFEISAIASSGFLPPDRLNTYSPLNLVDGRIDTVTIVDGDSYQLLRDQYDASGLVARKLIFKTGNKYIGVIVVEHRF